MELILLTPKYCCIIHIQIQEICNFGRNISSSAPDFNHLEEEEKAGCFAIIVLQMYCYNKCSDLWLFLTVLWVGVQYVIVVFPDQTRLLFGSYCIGNQHRLR